MIGSKLVHIELGHGHLKIGSDQWNRRFRVNHEDLDSVICTSRVDALNFNVDFVDEVWDHNGEAR